VSLQGAPFYQPVLASFSFVGRGISRSRSRLAILVCLRRKTATKQNTLDVTKVSANPDMFTGRCFSTNKNVFQKGRISTRLYFALRQHIEPASFGAARGASTSQGVVKFRADPPILHKSRRSDDLRPPFFTNCEGIGATLEVCARSAAQLQQATIDRGQNVVASHDAKTISRNP
jgi:hypothetical protein